MTFIKENSGISAGDWIDNRMILEAKALLKSTNMTIQQISDELDIVANYGWIRSSLWEEVQEDIKAVCDVCHKYGTEVKVIFETDALTIEQIKKATETAITAGADFVKTSTGFFTGGKSEGATVEVIRSMMEVADGRVKIKASGGIRTQEHFFRLIDMGIDRMGIGYKSTPVVLEKVP